MQSSSISIDFALLSLSDSSTTPSVSYSRTNQNFLKFYSELQSIKQSFESKRNSLPDEHQIYDFSVSQHQIELPPKTTIFPRHKKIPTGGSELTKWERFAQQKGINKKKRSRMVFDEIKQDWVPRWGARSIKQNRENENFAVEEKPGDMGDPFRKKGLEKELRNEKTKLRQNKNELLRKGIMKTDEKTEKKKKITKKTLEVAQVSTASMGKFDKKAHKDEPKVKQRKEKQKPVYENVSQEKNRYLDILKDIK